MPSSRQTNGFPSMEPLPRLAASRSKGEFFQRLGLSEKNDHDRQLYAKMKEEAVAGRQRTSQDPNNLVPQCRNDPNVRPPYSWDQISETAIYREVQNIYYSASPMTRIVYDRGRFMDGPNEDNWIIRWCLWHVFRYRDNRNKNRGRRSLSESPLYADGDVDGDVDGDGDGEARPAAGRTGGGQDQAGSQMWRRHLLTSGYIAPSTPGRSMNGYWDPVRQLS